MPVASQRTVRSEVIAFNTRTSPRTWTPALFGITDVPTYEAAKVGNGRHSATVSWLYRFFDGDKSLLYVGVTTNPSNRWAAHYHHDWWPLVRFASIEAVPPKDRLAHESAAIKAEKPSFNRTHTDRTRNARRPARFRIQVDRSADDIIIQLRERMSDDRFAALLAAFRNYGA